MSASGRTAAKGPAPCIVLGNVAATETTVQLASVKDAGTAVGLAGRLGANDARVESFDLRDHAAPQRRAIADAIARARAQAETIATASGAKLGPIVSVTDASANRGEVLDNLPQLRAPTLLSTFDVAPVRIDISPTPVETTAQLLVTFALRP